MGLLALLATQAPETAATPTPAEIAGKAYYDQLSTQMRTSASARERALFARISFDDPKAGGKALREAAQAAPTDPLVQFLWSTIGSGEWSGCDAASPCPEQAMAWARAEPSNGLAWLPPFNDLYKSGDEKAIDEAIAQMARAQAYDDHVIDAWQAYRKAIAARPMPAQVEATVGTALGTESLHPREDAEGIMAMAYAATLPLPLNSLTRACRREAHPDLAPARFENCARIGRAILDSNSSMILKTIATAVVRVSGQQNDADREAKRVLYWRQQAAVEAMNRPHGAEGYFADLVSTGSETRAQDLLLTRQGVALTPPKEWKAPGD